jgi:hypothetical protein
VVGQFTSDVSYLVLIDERDEMGQQEVSPLGTSELVELRRRTEELSRLLEKDRRAHRLSPRRSGSISLNGITVAISLVALSLSIFTTWANRQRQQRQDVAEFVTKNLEVATDPKISPVRRVSAVWALQSMWVYEEQWPVLVNSLAGLLKDDDWQVRAGAGDVIGLAITSDRHTKEADPLVRWLYGSTADWETGAVVRQNWELKAQLATYLMPGQPNCLPSQRECKQLQDKLEATREAIRKNWENLRGAHLRQTDLRGIRLYEAHLEGAALEEANLEGADLRGSWIEKTNFEGANLKNANVQDLHGQRPERFLNSYAVMMDAASFDRWRAVRYPAPKNWEAWRVARFPIDADGRPKW